MSEQPIQFAPPATNGNQPILLPNDMQPAQRVLTNLHELSDAELLSILLWGGTRQTEINAAYSLLQKVNGDLMMLRRHSTQELRADGPRRPHHRQAARAD